MTHTTKKHIVSMNDTVVMKFHLQKRQKLWTIDFSTIF